MRRRVVLFLRRGLLVLGVALLLWWPVSYVILPSVSLTWPFTETFISVNDGELEFIVWQGRVSRFEDAIQTVYRKPVGRDENDGIVKVVTGKSAASVEMTLSHFLFRLKPRLLRIPMIAGALNMLFIPLWLLAGLCLAWPVASFIFARRRRGRGFEVEPSNAGGSVHHGDTEAQRGRVGG